MKLEEIPPKVCVTRLCRFCHEDMNLDYEFDSEYRWYIFTCEDCGIISTLGEMIVAGGINNDDNYFNNDPLTKEEIEKQEEVRIIEKEYRERSREDFEK